MVKNNSLFLKFLHKISKIIQFHNFWSQKNLKFILTLKKFYAKKDSPKFIITDNRKKFTLNAKILNNKLEKNYEGILFYENLKNDLLKHKIV